MAVLDDAAEVDLGTARIVLLRGGALLDLASPWQNASAPNTKQRTILRSVAAIAILLFVVQPKTAFGTFPMGYRFFWSTEDFGNGQSAHSTLYTDYRALALEYVVLTIVGVCLYLAAGGVRKE